MSGANSEPRSDFGVATKWYYNWVPDESIIAMQPEGGTSTCPSCLKSGTFTIKAFDPDDWWNSPTSRDKLGIHIPIMAVSIHEVCFLLCELNIAAHNNTHLNLLISDLRR